MDRKKKKKERWEISTFDPDNKEKSLKMVFKKVKKHRKKKDNKRTHLSGELNSLTV